MISNVNVVRRPAVVLAISTFATAVSTPVFAQSADPVLEEITITAQRREETLQKSSLAIEVVSSDLLEKAGVTSASALTAVMPGVQVGSGGAMPQVYIRGVGDYGATSVSNPAVAFNVDGVYVARPQAASANFFDLQRVEVLKGPQGTLYGRNASGGAINLLPAQPKLGELSGYVEVGMQNYSGTSAEAALNVPLGETVALRFAAQAVNRDGYLSDGSSDDIHQTARVQLLWQPSSTFDARLWGSYAHFGGKGNGFALYDPAGNPDPKDGAGNPVPPATRAPLPSFDPWTSIASPLGNQLIAGGNAAITAQSGASPTGSYLDNFDASKIYQDLDFYNTHAELNWRMNWATLTVLPAYQSASMGYLSYPGLSYASTDLQGTPETSYASSLEARLANNTDQLKWVLGAFYFDESQQSRSAIDNGLLQRLLIIGEQTTRSYAAFGQATYSLSEPLRLIIGLRHTKEDKDARFNRYAFSPSVQTPATNSSPPVLCLVAEPCPIDVVEGSDQFSATNFRAGVEYDLGEQSMLFATAASGFKAGGISQAKVDPVKPEKLMAYTMGSRNRFFNDSLQVNLEGFYYDYKDHQEFVVGTDQSGRTGAFTTNAGNAASYGGSLDVIWALTRNDQVHVGAEYVQGRYDSFEVKQPTATVAPGSRDCAVSAVSGGVTTYDCSGKSLIRTPKWSALASYTHTFELSGGASVDAGFDMSYATKRWLTVDFIPNSLAPSYTLWNANVSYNLPDSKVSITGFIRNISNEAVYSGGGQSSFVGSLMGVNIGPPRTYGVRLRAKF